jgi:hypothetical protein
VGYFANGSEGCSYESKYCEKCIHLILEHGCPCLDAHMHWNYDECNNKDSILHKMIPRDKDGFNEQCIFFKENIPEDKMDFTCKTCGDPCSDICERCIKILEWK